MLKCCHFLRIWVWSMWCTDLGEVRWWESERGDPVAAAPARSTGWKVELLEEEPVGRWQEKTEQHAPPNPAPWRPARPARLLGGGDGGHGCVSAWCKGETRRQPKRRTRFFPCLCPCAPRRCKFSSFSIWLVDC